jgi:signal peptidase I
MKKILSNKWLNSPLGAFISSVGYMVGNYWFLLGLPIIFDIYVSKKVHWAFWKKKNPPNGKQTKTVEWIDAIIFAVIAASFIRLFFFEAYVIPTSSMEKSMMVGDYLFVSKVAYGPKMPNTPLSFPFVHQSMPLTNYKVNSYVEWIKRPYNRLGGLSKIKNDDVVVSIPEGDTVALNFPARIITNFAMYGRKGYKCETEFWKNCQPPVDKKKTILTLYWYTRR